MALMVWLISGLLAFAGSLSYAELGAAIPAKLQIALSIAFALVDDRHEVEDIALPQIKKIREEENRGFAPARTIPHSFGLKAEHRLTSGSREPRASISTQSSDAEGGVHGLLSDGGGSGIRCRIRSSPSYGDRTGPWPLSAASLAHVDQWYLSRDWHK